MPARRFDAAEPALLDAAHESVGGDSWRRHYRGAYSDVFLDREAPEFLGGLWTERLTEPEPRAHTLLAEGEDGVLVGLAHTMLDQDPDRGSFVDNLHVRHAVKRQGIGSRLLALTAQTVHRRSSRRGLQLWVLEQNTAAQAFYSARGGKVVERAAVPPPGGEPARLNGRPFGLRIAWPGFRPCTCGVLHRWESAVCRAVDALED